MEQTLLIIIIALVFVLVCFLGAMTFIGLRFLKMKQTQEAPLKAQEPVKTEAQTEKERKKVSPELLKSLRATGAQAQASYCIDHENEVSVGVCLLSGESYCAHCLTTYNNMKFAKKFLDLYLSSDWIELRTLEDKKDTQDKIDRVYNMKRELWLTRTLPLIIQGQFKINVETDVIESFVVVLTRVEDKEFIQKELSFL